MTKLNRVAVVLLMILVVGATLLGVWMDGLSPACCHLCRRAGPRWGMVLVPAPPLKVLLPACRDIKACSFRLFQQRLREIVAVSVEPPPY